MYYDSYSTYRFWNDNTSLVHHFENAKDVWSIDEGDLSYEDEAVRAHGRHFS